MMSRAPWNLLVTGGSLLVLVAAYLTLVQRPGEARIRALSRQIDQLTSTLPALPSRADETNRYNELLAAREASVESLEARFSEDVSPAELREWIRDRAKSAQLTISRFAPVAPDVRPEHRLVPLRLTVTGRYHQIHALLYGLETSPHMLEATEVVLRPAAATHGEPNLTAEIVVAARVLQP